MPLSEDLSGSCTLGLVVHGPENLLQLWGFKVQKLQDVLGIAGFILSVSELTYSEDLVTWFTDSLYCMLGA